MQSVKCPHCQNSRRDMIESVTIFIYYCGVCSKTFEVTDDTLTEGKESSGTVKAKISQPDRR